MAMILVKEGDARRHPDRARRDFSMVAQLLNIKIKQAEREQSRESKRFVKSKESIDFLSKFSKKFKVNKATIK